VARLVAIEAELFLELLLLVRVAGSPARLKRGVKLHWLGPVTLLLLSLFLGPLVARRSSFPLELAFVVAIIDFLSQFDHFLEVV
jgi:hypothetical protein